MSDLPIDRMLADATLLERYYVNRPYHGLVQDAACHIRALADALVTAKAERDRLAADVAKLIEAWPEATGDDPDYTVYRVSGGWYYDDEDCDEDRHGPFPTKEAAVRAAAGLAPDPEATS